MSSVSSTAYTAGTVPGSKKEIERIRHWVEKGKAWAQFMLARLYDKGEGVEQSHQQAAAQYEIAASQGDADAQYNRNLGDMYQNGEGVDQSYTREQKNMNLFFNTSTGN